MSIKVTIRRNIDLKEQVKRKAQAMLLDLHGGLVLKSPVADPDTWQRPDPGYVGGTFRNNWTVDLQAMTIENHTEYAKPLAEGHSPQAAKGWVEAEIDRATRL